jgi:DNA-binding transcriptional ArsR family regulator
MLNLGGEIMPKDLNGLNEMPLCPSKPSLQDRPLLSEEQTIELQGLFKVLSSDTRLRMLHAVARSGEMSVTDLAQTVCMKQQAVSNQLQRLVDRGVVASKRNGNHVHYRIVDPCVISLLEQGLCLVEEAKKRNK